MASQPPQHGYPAGTCCYQPSFPQQEKSYTPNTGRETPGERPFTEHISLRHSRGYEISVKPLWREGSQASYTKGKDASLSWLVEYRLRFTVTLSLMPHGSSGVWDSSLTSKTALSAKLRLWCSPCVRKSLNHSPPVLQPPPSTSQDGKPSTFCQSVPPSLRPSIPLSLLPFLPPSCLFDGVSLCSPN